MNTNNSIQLIDTVIPNSEKYVKIALEGKNLIITGANGCGKTRFLTQIHESVSAQVEQLNHKTADRIRKEIKQHKSWMSGSSPTNPNFHHWNCQLKKLELELIDVDKVNVHLGKVESYCIDFNERKALLRFFPAVREQSLAHTGSNDSLAHLKRDDEQNSLAKDSSSQFERYLVAFYNYGSHLLARVEDKAQSAKVDAWFANVENQLRYLFEDESLKLDYNAEEQAFYIKQDGKDPYRFDKLSSGYQSILSIYADLLMKVELKEISAEELSGVVLIDEIDAHLHVSLQRKIFSFFDQAFPNVQFIVTTHSPFVVQSVNNSIIYDLSTNEQLEDLSMYSYESILKGLLGVESTSDILNEHLDEMAELIHQEPLNKGRLKELTDSIEPYEAQLNARSRAFFLIGKNALLDSNDGEE
ncbi:AAA family ATPase [Vibrio breoganii]